MDKHLHIHILDALHQSNAIEHMVDIKPAFLDELDSQEKRKNFKAQLDYLVSEGLIETNGKFEFLGWELLTGLYPIDNKQIEARLTGNWQSFLTSRRGNAKREPVNLPPAQPPAAKKLGLYDAPSTVLPYPGVNVNKPEQVLPAIEEPVKDEDSDFIPFKGKTHNPTPVTDPNNVYLKEDDFLPFKTRAQSAKRTATPPPVEDPYSASVSNYVPPKVDVPKADAPKAEEPKAEEAKQAAPPEFSTSKTTYTPPKTEVKDVAVTVKPFTPPPAPTQHQAWAADDKPTPPSRIAVSVKRKLSDEEGDVPIITARTAGLRAKPAPPTELPPAEPEPPKEAPGVTRVVNLSSGGQTFNKPAAPVMAALRTSQAGQQPVANSHSIPPPPSNFAAVRFDTDNNPFAGLGTINLASDDDKPQRSSVWSILKWTIIIITLLAVIVGVVLYKKRYS